MQTVCLNLKHSQRRLKRYYNADNWSVLQRSEDFKTWRLAPESEWSNIQLSTTRNKWSRNWWQFYWTFFLPAPTLWHLFFKTLRTYNLRKIVVSLCIFIVNLKQLSFDKHTILLGTYFTVSQLQAHLHTRDIFHSMPVQCTLAYYGHISQYASYKHTSILGTYFTASLSQAR